MKLSDPRLPNIPTFESGVVIDDRLFLALHHQGDNALPGHLAQQPDIFREYGDDNR